MPLEHTVIHSHMPSNKSCAFRYLKLLCPYSHAQECLEPHVLPHPEEEDSTPREGPCHPSWGSHSPVLGFGWGTWLWSHTPACPCSSGTGATRAALQLPGAGQGTGLTCTPRAPCCQQQCQVLLAPHPAQEFIDSCYMEWVKTKKSTVLCYANVQTDSSSRWW